MKKRVLATMLAGVCTLAMTLAGCGSTAPAASGNTEAAGSTSAAATESQAAGNTNAAAAGTELTYWSMWNSTEGQAKVIQEAADAYEAATGIHINIEWKGRDIKTLIGPALDAGEKVDFFDTDYMILVQQNSKYLADLTDMAAAAGYEEHVLPILLDNAKEWGGRRAQNDALSAVYNRDMVR